jgi:2-dehydro-3-deoxygluconokinase
MEKTFGVAAAGDSPFDAVRYASAAAGIAVRGFGAVAPLPRPGQLRASP